MDVVRDLARRDEPPAADPDAVQAARVDLAFDGGCRDAERPGGLVERQEPGQTRLVNRSIGVMSSVSAMSRIRVIAIGISPVKDVKQFAGFARHDPRPGAGARGNRDLADDTSLLRHAARC